jgi:hypothetical protein
MTEMVQGDFIYITENSTSQYLRSKHVTFAKDKVYDSRVQLLFCIVREVKSDFYILS